MSLSQHWGRMWCFSLKPQSRSSSWNTPPLRKTPSTKPTRRIGASMSWWSRTTTCWQARCECMQVWYRGLSGQSFCRVYNMLGITGASKPRATKIFAEAPQGGGGSGMWVAGEVDLPGHKQRGCLLQNQKHLMNPGYKTEDVSSCIARCAKCTFTKIRPEENHLIMYICIYLIIFFKTTHKLWYAIL